MSSLRIIIINMLLADRPHSHFFQDDESRLIKNFKENDVGKKYKTEMCKNWQIGICKYGAGCIFAHGKSELRETVQKKKISCNNFSKNFYCPYGEKCQFIHEQVKLIKRRLPTFVHLSGAELDND